MEQLKISKLSLVLLFLLGLLVGCREQTSSTLAKSELEKLEICLETIEKQIYSYQTNISSLPEDANNLDYQDFVKTNTELNKLRNGYESSCENERIIHEEIKKLDNTLIIIGPLLEKFTETSNSLTPEDLKFVQEDFLEKKGFSVSNEESKDGDRKFGSDTKTKLAKYLRASSDILIEQAKKIQAAKSRLYMRQIDINIKSLNEQLSRLDKRNLILGILLISLPVVVVTVVIVIVVKRLDTKYREDLQEVVKQITAINVAQYLHLDTQSTETSPADSGADERESQKKDSSTGPPSEELGTPNEKLRQSSIFRQTDIKNTSTGMEKDTSSSLNHSRDIEEDTYQTTDLPSRVRELVHLYNQYGKTALNKIPNITEVSEPNEIIQQRIQGNLSQTSTIIFENKGHNEGDYLVFNLTLANENASRVMPVDTQSLWLFPKKIKGGKISIIESLFTITGAAEDYHNIQLIRPAQLDPSNFASGEHNQWKVRLIKKGEAIISNK